MKKGQIITIGRELGSGGREIGKRLSEELGIPFYDKEILDEAAKKSGYSKEIFEKHDEKPTSSFLYALAMGVTGFSNSFQRPLMLDLYLAQFNTMRKLAEEAPGIFLGRCADYVLSDMQPILSESAYRALSFLLKYQWMREPSLKSPMSTAFWGKISFSIRKVLTPKSFLQYSTTPAKVTGGVAYIQRS